MWLYVWSLLTLTNGVFDMILQWDDQSEGDIGMHAWGSDTYIYGISAVGFYGLCFYCTLSEMT